MSRLVPLAAVVFAAVGCARPPEPAPDVPPAVVELESGQTPAPGGLPVAPMPRASEPGPTNVDVGLDAKIEAALPELDRLDPKGPVAPLAVDGTAPGPKPDATSADAGGFTVQFPNRLDTRSKLIRENGGNEASERAVALALGWLARQQKQDGGWQFDAGKWEDDRVAATGLALLPFLEAGVTHKSGGDAAQNKYKEVVNKGLEFLKRNCPKDGPNAGKFDGATTRTAQALATLALCEAYGLTKDGDLKPFAQAAINFIQGSQAADGGWSDTPGGKSDILTSGGHIQALQAARLSRILVVDADVVKRAAGFLDAVAAGPRKAMYGTTDASDAKPGTLATAVGLLCRCHIGGWGPNHPGMIEGVAGLKDDKGSGLIANPPGTGALRDTLYFHHATRVIALYGGEEWKTWNEGPKGPDGARKGGMRDWLVNAQAKNDGVDRGSWDAEGDWGERTGRLGATALNALTLEVYYRYPPHWRGAVKILEDK
jgi:hypothetical protein